MFALPTVAAPPGSARRGSLRSLKAKIMIPLSLLTIAGVLALVLVIGFIVRRQILLMAETKVRSDLRTTYNLLDLKYPGPWEARDGHLFKGGRRMDGDWEPVDWVAGQTGSAATIFLGDTRASTTVRDDRGERMVSTRAAPNVQEAVLRGGTEYSGIASVVGVDYMTAYRPIREEGGKIVGMWFVGMPLSALGTTSAVREVLLGGFLLALLIILGTVGLSGALLRTATRPLHDLAEATQKIAGGDLSVRVPESEVRDLEPLTRASGGMVESLREILSQINGASTSVACAVEEILATTEQLTRGAQTQAAAVDETSASMEEMAASILGVARNAEGLAANVEQTTSSIQELGFVAQGVARSAESMASNVAQTSATIEQMLQGLERTAQNVQRADHLSQRASEEARGGSEAVLKTVQGMRVISDAMGNISQVVQNLGERSEAIGSIVGVIEEIADQTNLLALNAAIEAARAGDAGRGFAVVADEVRKLAERSIKATKEIGEVIRQVQRETASAVRTVEEGGRTSREGFEMADKAGSAISRIMEAVDNTSSIMAEISSATGEQTRAAGYVMKAVEEMNHLTETVTRSTKEQALGIDQVVKASQSMAHMTEQVKNATAEQKLGGESVVSAVENIREIARSNLDAAEQLSRSARGLANQSDGLTKMVLRFKLS
jgi:methyl-accepting chemotaxis protein